MSGEEKPPFWPPPPGWQPGAVDASTEEAPSEPAKPADAVEPAPPKPATETRPASEPLVVKGHTGTVTFDGRMITITRAGFLARTSVGKGEKQIPLAHVTAVQFKPAGPVMNGFIQFTVGGGNERRSQFGSQTRGAVRDENSVVFHYRQREAFEGLRDAVQSAMAELHSAAQPQASVAPGPTIPDQIKQLADLHDQGILTSEEFEAKKRELLDRL